jgi:putative two-component system response regulator
MNVSVSMADNGMDAIAALEQDHFDVVLCDYRMPGTNGIDVLLRAMEIQPDASRLLISAETDFEIAMRAVNQVGLFRILSKPIRMSELRLVVSEAVRESRLQAENRALTRELAVRNAALERANGELQAKVAEQTMHAVCVMLRTLGLWSEEHFQNSERTAHVAKCIAIQMRLHEADVVAIDHGSRIRDIGLIAVPKSVLCSPGPLDVESEIEMQNHVHIGSMLVQEMEFLGDARRIVAEHHEWWDGNGYPRRLAGEQIYIGARVVAVADAYTTLTAGGAFRQSVSHEIAIAEVKQWSDVQFDRSVVNALSAVPIRELTIDPSLPWEPVQSPIINSSLWNSSSSAPSFSYGEPVPKSSAAGMGLPSWHSGPMAHPESEVPTDLDNAPLADR